MLLTYLLVFACLYWTNTQQGDERLQVLSGTGIINTQHVLMKLLSPKSDQYFSCKPRPDIDLIDIHLGTSYLEFKKEGGELNDLDELKKRVIYDLVVTPFGSILVR